MTPIEQAIDALKHLGEWTVNNCTGWDNEAYRKAADAIDALQSMQGDAVGTVSDVYGSACVVGLFTPVELGQHVYTQPQSPAVPEGIDAFLSDVQAAIKSGEATRADMLIQGLRISLSEPQQGDSK